MEQLKKTTCRYIHNVAKIRVKPIQAESTVCPTPHTIAYTGDICKLDARWTNAMAALLTTPLVAGERTPITTIKIEKNLPNLCFRNVTKATNAAQVCINIDENSAHKNIWYHISGKVFRGCPSRSPITSARVSSSIACSLADITIISYICFTMLKIEL